MIRRSSGSAAKLAVACNALAELVVESFVSHGWVSWAAECGENL
jgi:hypothetical protein